MSVHHPNRHHEGEGVKLIGCPVELLNLMLPGADENSRAIDQIENEGPKYRQVFSSLLLNRLYRLVRNMEQASGNPFVLQEGYELIKEEKGNEITIPVSMPVNLGSDLEKKQIADAISYAPEHEILVYAMGLQVIEWAIKATEKNLRNN